MTEIKLFQKINSLFKSRFAKNFLMISGGTAFAQLLSFVLSPVITRLYSPEEFGVLTLYISLLTMVGFLFSLSYELAIPIADNDEKAINVLFLCITILILMTFFLTMSIFFAGDFLFDKFNSHDLAAFKYFIPLGFFAAGLYNILSKWSFRKKDYRALAKTKYSQSIMGNTAKIGLGLMGCGSIGLLIGQILKSGAGIITLAKPLFKTQGDLFNKISKQEIIWNAKRYIAFPQYSAPTYLLVSLSSQLPVVFISFLYTPAIVGLYGFARGMTFLPMTLIGKSVEDVFYGEAANIGRNNPRRIKELYNKLLKKLIIFAVPPMIILIVFGPPLFSFVFGSNWYEAGVYSRLLSIYVFAYFISHPVSTLFYIFEQQKKALFLNIVNLLSVLIVFGTAMTFSFNPHTTVLMYSIVKGLVELIRYLLLQKIINNAIDSMEKNYT